MRNTSLKLSAVISVHNEENQLAECLKTLEFADEIVVLLDKCSDGSEAIAQVFTNRIVPGAWPKEGARRSDLQFGRSKTSEEGHRETVRPIRHREQRKSYQRGPGASPRPPPRARPASEESTLRGTATQSRRDT